MISRIKIYHIPVIICFTVAITQFILSTSFSLTRWEGGGFGMYSEINPTISRAVWIRLENSNGDFRVRLYPTDRDLLKYIDNLPDDEKKNWNKLLKETMRIRNFPAIGTSSEFMENAGLALLNVNQTTNKAMRRNNSRINVHIEVMEISLDVADKMLKSEITFKGKTEL